MSERVRVYDLARELGLTSKELIAMLAAEGLEVKSHASTLETEYADLVRDHVISERKSQTRAKRAETAEKEEARAEEPAPEAEEAREIHLKPPIVVRDLAEALGCKPNELIGELMTLNVFAAINQIVETELVEQICARHGFNFVRERRERPAKMKVRESLQATGQKEPTGKAQPRPPVVAFLGHVDHGKTSLLDYIRQSQVTKGEAGGITQHIGASVISHAGHHITLLDTPGHEAFTAMRARGANATDIVVLVVAADDGVMPQTIEAINHARAAEVPIVVAMNKMDLPGADPDKVMLGLQQQSISPEAWGGEVGVMPVSAITGDGIDGLLERILLEAEVMELQGNPELPCDGLVIEAQLESGMGPTSSVLVRNGTLHVGDVILSGEHCGRAKALIDDRGNRIECAGPSTPVKVLGLSGVPEAGSRLTVLGSEREARMTAEGRSETSRQGELAVTRHANLEDLFRQIEEDMRKELKLILKTDVQGSQEAITDSLAKITSEKISINIIHSGVGEITENDVLLAAASDAIVVGFHVRAMPGVNRTAKHRGVEIRLYSVIYELLEEIADAMRGRLSPEVRETPLGTAEILQVFKTSQAGNICGCMVTEGMIRTGASAKVLREDELIYNGLIQSLRRFKDDVREVRNSLECGIRLDNFEDFEVGDIIKVAALEEFAAEL